MDFITRQIEALNVIPHKSKVLRSRDTTFQKESTNLEIYLLFPFHFTELVICHR